MSYFRSRLCKKKGKFRIENDVSECRRISMDISTLSERIVKERAACLMEKISDEEKYSERRANLSMPREMKMKSIRCKDARKQKANRVVITFCI